jgi:Tfp pilus assembly protein PilF
LSGKLIFIVSIAHCTIVKPHPSDALVSSGWIRFIVCGAIVALTWIVFGQTLGHEFINFDDPLYVSENPQIQAGLNWRNVVWAFTHVHSNNWHPVTTMSHMLDCQLFGLKPGPHHFVNVLLHSATAVLVLLLLEQMTGALWSSAFVAAVFAIHPLHVESVAWISERKDVLSGLFFVLTLLAYVGYARKPGVARYVTLSILFVCGLLSKPMLVTLPLVLLLLDYWPLKRFERTGIFKLVLEKIPLLALSIAAAVATLIAQNQGIGLVRLKLVPLSWRITNALAAFVVYIWQTVWPVNLATLYPHPGRLLVWESASAGAFLAVVTVVAFLLRKRQPYLITGWLWYLIMLLPVIGLIQVGSQAHADRYTYLPQIGLCVAATWSVIDLTRRFRWRRECCSMVGPIIIAALAWRAWVQTSYWQDTERLWNRAFAVTGRNDLAHFGYGEFLLKQHRLDDAIAQFQIVLMAHPAEPDANFQIGSAFMEKGELDLAARHFERTLKVEPENLEAETNFANALMSLGRTEEAVDHYRNVVRHQPSSALGHYNLAVGLHRLGHLPEAIVHYKEALAIDPNYPDAKDFLEQAESENGQKNNER